MGEKRGRLVEPRDLDLSASHPGTIPGREPELKLSIPRIPVSEGAAGRIIPVCEPVVDGNEAAYVARAVSSGWISSAGKFIPEFEERFAVFCGTKHAVACTSGTTALHLAFATLGIGPGDEVIVPTFTMIATANAVRYAGGTPVFVDSEPETGNIDPDGVDRAITPRTKAVVPIHTYGHPADMERLLSICGKHGLYLVEDAAEAHGAEWKGRRAGSIGDVGCFSFYANKIITTGEGGMLVTDNPDIARIARNLRDHAFSEERHFWHKFQGYNYRMTNLQAAVGVAQMERIVSFVEARRRNAARYTTGLAGLPGLKTPVEKPGFKNVFWMYGIRLDEKAFGLDRDGLRRELAERGIETRTFFIPMHLQPIFFKAVGGEYPVAEDLCRRGMYLPSASSLTSSDVDIVVEAIRQIHTRAKE